MRQRLRVEIPIVRVPVDQYDFVIRTSAEDDVAGMHVAVNDGRGAREQAMANVRQRRDNAPEIAKSPP